MRYLVTGGLGFIGSAVVRSLYQDPMNEIYVVDKWGYAADPRNLTLTPNVKFLKLDLTNAVLTAKMLSEINPEYVIHLAAESHVDNSISSPKVFLESNIMGTFNLLEAIRYMGDRSNLKKFVHVSTDEVYGDLGDSGVPFTEETPYNPSSPYSASKAASDHLVRAWHRTYGIPAVITNCSNNFGPYQHPEKLIPTVITSIMTGKQIPLYGSGLQVRDWLFVDDHVDAILNVAENGAPGETYNVGSRNPRTNIDIIYMICDYMDSVHADKGFYPASNLITTVKDRPGHDTRYEVDPTKLEEELDWTTEGTFEEKLYATIEWYIKNDLWWRSKI